MAVHGTGGAESITELKGLFERRISDILLLGGLYTLTFQI